MNNREDVVRFVTAQYPQMFGDVTKPFEYNNDANCAEITRLVCEELEKRFPLEKWGLLTKSVGEAGFTWPNGLRTSIDVIALPNGERVDIIGNSGSTEHKPFVTWQERKPNEWRPNNVWVDWKNALADKPQEPERPTNPVHKKDYERDFGGDARGVKFMEILFADYHENKVPPNPGMGTWPWRVMFDSIHNGLTLEEAVEKQRDEWVTILGGKRSNKEL